MKAVVVEKTGGPEVLCYTNDVPVPKLKENEVLIRNTLVGINFIDTAFRSGRYSSSLPLILGQEGVGTVAAVSGSNTTGLAEGDKVVWMGQGGYAEYTAVPSERVVKTPPNVNNGALIGSFITGLATLALTKEAYAVKKDDIILVHAAAGGVGLLMCQALKELGATVIGTASTAQKCDAAVAHGAAHMINYKETSNWVAEVEELTPDGVDYVYDSVGATTWESSLAAVKRKGVVVFFGNASGPVPPFPISKLTPKNIKVMRASAMNYMATREEFEYYVKELFRSLESNKLNANIHRIYGLNETQQAHRDPEGRLTSGKLLLRI